MSGCVVTGLDDLQLQEDAGDGVLHTIALANLEYHGYREEPALTHVATSEGVLGNAGLSSLAGKGIVREHDKDGLDTDLVAVVGEAAEGMLSKLLKVVTHGSAVEGDALDHDALALLCIGLPFGLNKSKLTGVEPVEE